MITPRHSTYVAAGIRVRQRIEDDRKRSRHIQLGSSTMPDAPLLHQATELRWFVLRVPLSKRQCCGSPGSIFVLETRRICPQAAITIAISRFHRSNLRISAWARVSRDEKLIGVGVPRYFCRLITLTKERERESVLINFAAQKWR